MFWGHGGCSDFVVLTPSCKNLTPLTTAFLSTFRSAFNTFEWHQRIKKLQHLSLSSSAPCSAFLLSVWQTYGLHPSLVSLPPSTLSQVVSPCICPLIALMHFFHHLNISLPLSHSYCCCLSVPSILSPSAHVSPHCLGFFAISLSLCFPISLPPSPLAV